MKQGATVLPGPITPSKYNALSWALREKISPPVPQLTPAEVRWALGGNSIKTDKKTTKSTNINMLKFGDVSFRQKKRPLRE